MKKILVSSIGILLLTGCIHHPRYSELLHENEQLKQEVEVLKIQLGKEKEQVAFQVAQANYRAKVAEEQRYFCDSLLKASNKRKN
jgi:hypothetical protein